MIVESITPLGAALLAISMAASLRRPLPAVARGAGRLAVGVDLGDRLFLRLAEPGLDRSLAGSAAGIGLLRIGSWAAALYRQRPTPDIIPETDHLGNGFRILPPGSEGNTSLSSPTAWLDSLHFGHLAGAVAALLAAACLCVSDAALLDCQRQQQRAVGVPELNRCLYAYAADHPDCAAIATDYQAMEWLPDMGGRRVVCTCQELAAFRRSFDRPEVGYVLVRTQGAAADVRGFLADATAAHLVFENHGFAFYEKLLPGENSAPPIPKYD